MSVEVISKRKGGYLGNDINCVIDISRTSVLGNPFKVAEHGRGVCIKMYEDHFDTAIASSDAFRAEFLRIVALVDKGHRVGLQCWCAPAPCHGDVLKKKVEQYIGETLLGDHKQIEEHEKDVAAQAEHPDEIVHGIPFAKQVLP